MTQLNSDQLHAGIRALAIDAVDAVIHWKLSRGILEATVKWPLVTQQSNTFWQLTITAHVNVSVLAMCRVFDQQKTALHLHGLLQLIKKNLPLFDEAQFRERLCDNSFVESLAQSARRPDARQLATDIALCSPRDPLVKQLVTHRNTAVAHLSQKRHLNRTPTRTDEEIKNSDFEILLNRAVEIVNRYSSLFGAEHFSTQVIGHDDYETVFLWVQERVEQERTKWSV